MAEERGRYYDRYVNDSGSPEPDELRIYYRGSAILPNTSTTLYYSSEGHAKQPQQELFHSEWRDSPFLRHNMETTTQVINRTPSKQPQSFYVTPTSDHKIKDHVEPETPPKKNKVSTWEIFWEMINDVTGKDKLAKVGQYVLRLALYHADKTQTYLSEPGLNIDIISKRYNSKLKQLNLLRNFIKHPANFFKIVIILLCFQFQQKFLGMAKHLSIYRQFLRFGRSPFRLRGLLVKLRDNIKFKNGQMNINHQMLSRKTLGEVFGLYYALFDESLLLLKIGVYNTKWTGFQEFVARHESLAWYYDSWLNLYNAYDASNTVSQQEMDLKVLIEVKNKAKMLLKQLLGNGSRTPVPATTSPEDAKQLEEIQFRKTNAYLDIYKNISDIVFNTYTVFNLALPFDTVQIWMGISASTLSTIKVYREAKKRLEEK